VDRDDIAEAFFDTAVRRANEHGMRLGQGADYDIRRLAMEAAVRIRLHADTGAAEQLAQELESGFVAFQRLIDEMVSAASNILDYRQTHPGVIGEETLNLALLRLCPLFPIC